MPRMRRRNRTGDLPRRGRPTRSTRLAPPLAQRLLVQGTEKTIRACLLGDRPEPADSGAGVDQRDGNEIYSPGSWSKFRSQAADSTGFFVGEGIFGNRNGPPGHGLHLNDHPTISIIGEGVYLSPSDPHIAVDDHEALSLEKRCSDRFAEPPDISPG